MKVFLWQKSDHFLVLIDVFLSGFIEPYCCFAPNGILQIVKLKFNFKISLKKKKKSSFLVG